MRSVTSYGDMLIAVGDQRMMYPLWDAREGPALSWVSADGGNTWTRVEDPTGALGSSDDRITIRQVTVLNDTIVALGSVNNGLAVWIGEWQTS